jgi:hypothetical protein
MGWRRGIDRTKVAGHLAAPSVLRPWHSRAVLPLLLLVSLTAVLAGGQASPSDRLRAILDTDEEFLRRENPEFSTILGDHRFSTRWTDYSKARYERLSAHAREVLRSLAAIDAASGAARRVAAVGAVAA